MQARLTFETVATDDLPHVFLDPEATYVITRVRAELTAEMEASATP